MWRDNDDGNSHNDENIYTSGSSFSHYYIGNDGGNNAPQNNLGVGGDNHTIGNVECGDSRREK